MVPASLTVTDGKDGPLRLPADRCWKILATGTGDPQVRPPLTERNATIPDWDTIGTTTVPSRSTTGSPPVACSLVAVLTAGDQVRPPSLEVLIMTSSPWATWSATTSHSMQQLP